MMREDRLPITEFTPGNEVARAQLDKKISALQGEVDRAYQQLDMYGVPPGRARNVANGIQVLATRYERKCGLQKLLLEGAEERATFDMHGPDPATDVLRLLDKGEISVGKAAEWLREYIHSGHQGALPEAT